MALFLLGHILIFTTLLHRGYALEPFESVPANIAEEWTIQGPANLASVIHLRIALVNSKDAEFEDRAVKVATLFSGHYRKHIMAAELAVWTEPHAGDVRRVQEWLEEYGVGDSEQDHDLIKVVATIEQAQDLLNTTFSIYQHSRGNVVQRTPEYYIPSHLTPLIELVHPTVNFPSSNHRQESRSTIHTSPRHSRALSDIDLDLKYISDDPCDSFATTPACANKLYNATYYAPHSSNVTIANAGGGNRVNRTNLKQYLEKFNPGPLERQSYLVESFTGGNGYPIDGQHPFEDQLLEMMMGSGGNLGGEMLNIIGDIGSFEWGPVKHNGKANHRAISEGEHGYIDFLYNLSHTSFPQTTVIADASYQFESDLSPKYMRYLCKILGGVSSRGITFLQQVDDYGSGAYPEHGKVVFKSAFPSTCPWVSGVGTTVWDRNDGMEKATTWATRGIQAPGLAALSSGLFSQTFERPKWQNKFVQPYLSKFKLAETYSNGSQIGGIVTTGFNPTGRALPDFSVFGARIPTTVNGTVTVTNSAVYGAPIAAGFISRLNAYEQCKGRPLLGSLNPFFYSRPDLFTDITCCGTNSIVDAFPTYEKYAKVNPYGFPVAEGWDVVTGLGSLKFADILRALDDMAENGALN